MGVSHSTLRTSGSPSDARRHRNARPSSLPTYFRPPSVLAADESNSPETSLTHRLRTGRPTSAQLPPLSGAAAVSHCRTLEGESSASTNHSDPSLDPRGEHCRDEGLEDDAQQQSSTGVTRSRSKNPVKQLIAAVKKPFKHHKSSKNKADDPSSTLVSTENSEETVDSQPHDDHVQPQQQSEEALPSYSPPYSSSSSSPSSPSSSSPSSPSLSSHQSAHTLGSSSATFPVQHQAHLEQLELVFDDPQLEPNKASNSEGKYDENYDDCADLVRKTIIEGYLSPFYRDNNNDVAQSLLEEVGDKDDNNNYHYDETDHGTDLSVHNRAIKMHHCSEVPDAVVAVDGNDVDKLQHAKTSKRRNPFQLLPPLPLPPTRSGKEEEEEDADQKEWRLTITTMKNTTRLAPKAREQRFWEWYGDREMKSTLSRRPESGLLPAAHGAQAWVELQEDGQGAGGGHHEQGSDKDRNCRGASRRRVRFHESVNSPGLWREDLDVAEAKQVDEKVMKVEEQEEEDENEDEMKDEVEEEDLMFLVPWGA
ncbi:hypothetical protein DFQ26_006210 [Actinomortierella ambigua]|nr:hypothetical protein DFQ26_006210 [Actinomortierella ambigua]